MTSYAFVAPILEGKRDVLNDMIAQLRGDFFADAEEIRRSAGIDREQVFLLPTPMGDLAIVVWNTDDLAASFARLRSDSSTFGEWFAGKLQEIHGFDVRDASFTPDLTIGYEWTDPAWQSGAFESNTICFPLKPGCTDDLLAWADELAGARNSDFVRTRGELGITRQSFILQRTPQGDFAIMYGEGTPGWFQRGAEANTNSDEPIYAWFRESLSAFAAVPLFVAGTDMPSPERILDLNVKTTAAV